MTQLSEVLDAKSTWPISMSLALLTLVQVKHEDCTYFYSYRNCHKIPSESLYTANFVMWGVLGLKRASKRAE